MQENKFTESILLINNYRYSKMRQLILLISIFLTFSAAAYSQHTDSCSATVQYEVKKGDFLYKIAVEFGDARFWEPIYIANADRMANPNLIFPGQKILIPASIAGFSESGQSAGAVLENPFCEKTEIPVASVDRQFLVRFRLDDFIAKHSKATESEKPVTALIDTLTEDEKMEEFRKAFESLVKAGEKPESVQSEKEKIVRMEVDGMILDETISKIGRDFYNIFYQYWQAPPEAYNFTVRISEQPAPNLGTMVSVTVNDTKTFQSRLQPRFDTIEEAGKQAVRMSHHYLKNNKNQFIIY